MRTLLLALIIISCGARERQELIKELKATPTPEATVVEEPTEELIPEVTPEPTPIVIVVIITPTPAPTPSPEQIEKERTSRYNRCESSHVASCSHYSGPAALRCRGKSTCGIYKTMSVEDLGPFENWDINGKK